MQSENSESSTEEHREEFNEEATIKYYFSCGYEYNEILGFLSKHHSCNMSYSALLRRLKDYGLHCRHVKDSPNFDNTFQMVLPKIRELVSGPENSKGCRAVMALSANGRTERSKSHCPRLAWSNGSWINRTFPVCHMINQKNSKERCWH